MYRILIHLVTDMKKHTNQHTTRCEMDFSPIGYLCIGFRLREIRNVVTDSTAKTTNVN